MSTDVYYPSVPEQWLTEAVLRNTGYAVEVNPELEATAAVDRINSIIEIRPGLTFPRFHISLSRAALFAVFDDTVVPEFRAAGATPKGVTRLHSGSAPRFNWRYSLSS